MSDRAALVAAIVAHPEEDTPRLMFADWLDEQGDGFFAAWATLIRAQVEFARTDRYSSRWLELGHEQVRVFQSRPRDWAECWRGRLGAPTYRRGFREAARVSAGAFRTAAARLFGANPVRALHITNLVEDGGWADRDLHTYPEWARVETLDLRGNGARAVAKFLARVAPRAPKLRALGFGTLGLTAGQAGNLLAVPVPGLRALDLHDNPLFFPAYEDMRPESVFHAPALAGVTWLDLYDTQPTVAAAEALAHSPVLRGLRYLDFGRGIYRGSAEPLGTAGARALAGGPAVRGVEVLDLSGHNIGAAGAEALAHSPLLDTVRELNLANNDLGDDGIIALAHSPRAANLRRLDISTNNMTEAGAAALLASPHLAGVTVLRYGEHSGYLPLPIERQLVERFSGSDPACGSQPIMAVAEAIP